MLMVSIYINRYRYYNSVLLLLPYSILLLNFFVYLYLCLLLIDRIEIIIYQCHSKKFRDMQCNDDDDDDMQIKY